MSFIGPVLPDHLKKRKPREEESGPIGPTLESTGSGERRGDDALENVRESTKNDEIGPSMDSVRKRQSVSDDKGEIHGGDRSSDHKRIKIANVIGPTMPNDDFEDESSDEDDEFTIGPLPPSEDFIQLEESRHRRSQPASGTVKGAQREEWIASLPETSSVARKLGFGKSMTSFSQKPVSSKEIVPIEQDSELSEAVDQYNKSTRPESLVEIHKKKAKKEKKDETPIRQPFDFKPQEDLKIKSMDPQQTRSIVNKAQLLNSRFSNPKGSNKFL